MATDRQSRPQATLSIVKALLFPVTTGLVLQVFLMIPANLTAQTMYVRPSSEVVVRRGQGTEFKIVAMVKNGTALELVEQQKDYSKVRLENGTEGWILRRFLSETPPLTKVVDTLRKENALLVERENISAENLEKVSADLQQTQAELQDLAAEKERLDQSYQTLVSDTANVVKIKEAQQSTAAENEKLQQRLSVVMLENDELKKDNKLNWFLVGAGVLLAGFIAGRLPTPKRRRKSSLM